MIQGNIFEMPRKRISRNRAQKSCNMPCPKSLLILWEFHPTDIGELYHKSVNKCVIVPTGLQSVQNILNSIRTHNNSPVWKRHV